MYVENGEIKEWESATPLPNFTGLCMLVVNGSPYITYTDVDPTGKRTWDIVHPGSMLDLGAIEKFQKLRTKKA